MTYPNYGKYNKYGKPKTFSAKKGLEYKTYRVKSPIKSFRDLEVYKKTNELAAEIFQIKLPPPAAYLKKELELLGDTAKQVPRLIGESYGNKFVELTLALNKLEKAAEYISNIITKLDFLLISIREKELKECLNKLLKRYQTQRVKILNLKRAWQRVFGKAKNDHSAPRRTEDS